MKQKCKSKNSSLETKKSIYIWCIIGILGSSCCGNTAARYDYDLFELMVQN